MTCCRLDDVSLYGVFDGHDSARASNFAAQRMPAELLLGQLSGKTTDQEIQEALYQVNMCPIARKPICRVSEKERYKSAYAVTQASSEEEIRWAFDI